MFATYSPKTQDLLQRLNAFFDQHIYPNEAAFHGEIEANRAKAFSRVGMGRCQGRYCGEAAAEVIAAASGVATEAVGRLRAQAPVKPLGAATRGTP